MTYSFSIHMQHETTTNYQCFCQKTRGLLHAKYISKLTSSLLNTTVITFSSQTYWLLLDLQSIILFPPKTPKNARRHHLPRSSTSSATSNPPTSIQIEIDYLSSHNSRQPKSTKENFSYVISNLTIEKKMVHRLPIPFTHSPFLVTKIYLTLTNSSKISQAILNNHLSSSNSFF